ncbi:MAG: hypothetical protein ACK4N5_17530, partial [Myxococcales bacterium]
MFLGDLESVVPLPRDFDGTLSLSLDRLPAARVAVGDTDNRLAYGTLLLVEDVTGDGEAQLVAPRSGG